MLKKYNQSIRASSELTASSILNFVGYEVIRMFSAIFSTLGLILVAIIGTVIQKTPANTNNLSETNVDIQRTELKAQILELANNYINQNTSEDQKFDSSNSI